MDIGLGLGMDLKYCVIFLLFLQLFYLLLISLLSFIRGIQMKNRLKYSYMILRYVHDVATSEFVNVGVAVYCEENNFFKVKLSHSTSRVSTFFSNLDVKSFRILLKIIDTKFTEVSNVGANLPLFESNTNLQAILSSVTPKDDSALVWSNLAFGITDNLEKTVGDLFGRYVTQYIKDTHSSNHTDDDI